MRSLGSAVTSGVSTITDYGLGARGVDYISSTKSGTTTVGFPIYDAHGNMTACLFRSVSNYYSLRNQRHYDAWGAIRNGAISGDPKGRYCASLGHKQDDESGLVYIRARYYEPSSGRFLSSDAERQGRNLFAYCSDDPADRVDQSGKWWLDFTGISNTTLFEWYFAGGTLLAAAAVFVASTTAGAIACLDASIMCFTGALGVTTTPSNLTGIVDAADLAVFAGVIGLIAKRAQAQKYLPNFEQIVMTITVA